MSKLGDYIRARREDNDWSQADLAKASGLSPGYISQIESGINPSTGRGFSPKVETLDKLAKALRLPLEVLIDLAQGKLTGEAAILDPSNPRIAQTLQRLAALPEDRQEEVLQLWEAQLAILERREPPQPPPARRAGQTS